MIERGHRVGSGAKVLPTRPQQLLRYGLGLAAGEGAHVGDIKSMGLYRNVERILADLEASGHDPNGPLSVDDLTPYDQYHYEGTDAVDDALDALHASPDSHLIDVGSGLGGPARYAASRSGARVAALELQADLNEVAHTLTSRCGLDDRVSHICGDVTAGDAPAATFTGLMSMLCFLHIPEREVLFRECAAALVPGAVMFIDDYFAREPLTEADSATLRDKVYCPYLPSLDQYIADVKGGGFSDVVVVDKTDDWTTFVVDRLDAFRSNRDVVAARYGETTVDELDDFYAAVADLFTSGRLGGLRLTATKP